MKTYHGGEMALPGIYLSRASLEFTTVPREGGLLPGQEKTNYWKLAPPVAIVLGPMMAMVYVMFVPATGFIAGMVFLGMKVKQGYRLMARESAQVASLSWVPGRAYLVRRRKAAKQKETQESKEAVDALLKDIQERRKGDKQ